jgi:hypothetical protein
VRSATVASRVRVARTGGRAGGRAGACVGCRCFSGRCPLRRRRLAGPQQTVFRLRVVRLRLRGLVVECVCVCRALAVCMRGTEVAGAALLRQLACAISVPVIDRAVRLPQSLAPVPLRLAPQHGKSAPSVVVASFCAAGGAGSKGSVRCVTAGGLRWWGRHLWRTMRRSSPFSSSRAS